MPVAVPITTAIPVGVPTVVPEVSVAGDITITAFKNGKGSCTTLTPIPGGPTATAQSKGDTVTMWALFAAAATKAATLITQLDAAAGQ